MLSFMVLVVVHSSQLYRKIHSANTLKWRIFCDKVRYLLLYTWLFSFMVLMVIIFRRCMSSLVSSRLPSSLYLLQESFPLIGVASGTNAKTITQYTIIQFRSHFEYLN